MLKPPKHVLLPSTAHRLPDSHSTMGKAYIERLRALHDVDAWAFSLPDHIVGEALREGFKNDSERAKCAASRYLMGMFFTISDGQWVG